MIARRLPILLLLLALTLAPGAASFLRAEITDEMAKKLFSPDTPLEELEKVAAEVRKQGAPAQIVAEAKLAWGLKNQDTLYLSKLVPELEAVAKDFKKENSTGLGTELEFKALIHYIRALDAARAGESEKVKEHITEAFWLSPEQAPLFAQTITFFRRQAQMAKIKIDMKAPITTSRADDTTLKDLVGKNKAVLLDFWASWCGPCLALMPELREKAEYLRKHGVVVAAMNTESNEGLAEKVRRDQQMEDVPWLVEPVSKPFSAPLEVDTLPRMVLLTPEGKVLFNGFPEDPALWAALKNVDAAIEPMKKSAAEAPPAQGAAPATGETPAATPAAGTAPGATPAPGAKKE